MANEMGIEIGMKILEVVAGRAVDAWCIQDDIWRLQATLPKIDVLMSKAEQWRFRDANIPKLLSFLKDAAYDAEDILDLFNYYVLEKIIENVQASQYSDTLKSFFNSLPARVRGIQSRLDHASSQMLEVIGMLPDECDNLAILETGSMETGEELLGRNEELKTIMEILNHLAAPGAVESSSTNGPKRKRDEEQQGKVHIVPIVGMGGVGKTALARAIYNNREPSLSNLDKRWIWVSEKFDVVRIINEIIGDTKSTEQTNGTSLDALQLSLHRCMSRKFLIVLDDFWTENVVELDKVLIPLRSGQCESIILVTTRSQNIAELIKTKELIHLEGLPDNIIFDLLNRYIFGSSEAEHSSSLSVHDPDLRWILTSMASKLKGSPLAAKTLGGVLKCRRDKEYWRSVMNSDIWELLKQNKNDIVPALQLSYRHLPAQLKKCFSFFSMFPKGYDFCIEDIIDLWVAHGLISPEGNKDIRGLAIECFNGLKMRFFLEKSQIKDQYYVLHDLMHDLAQSVAFGECYVIYDGNVDPDIPNTIRYLSVSTSKVKKNVFEELCRFKKLRSLVVLNEVQNDLGSTMKLWFEKLTNIRCLKINACSMKELPSNIKNLKHLRYIDIPYAGERTFPMSLLKLYNLQCIYLQGWKGYIHGTTEYSKLINLRIFYPVDKVISSICSSGKLIYLETVPHFRVQKESDISQLEVSNQIQGSLCVRNLEKITSDKSALQAGLNKKEYLDELILEWSPNEATNSDQVFQVIEGLKPHQNLKSLEIREYSGSKLPPWLGNLPCLSILTIANCPGLCEFPKIPLTLTKLTLVNVGVTTLPAPRDDSSLCQIVWPMRSALSDLHLEECSKISTLKDWLLAKNFPKMKSICIRSCESLKVFPAGQFKKFEVLETLKIISCDGINEQISLPCKMSTLELDNSKLWDLNSVRKLRYMVNLRLHKCQIIEDANDLTALVSLKYLSLQDCEAICCLSGLKALTNLHSLSIIRCPKLHRQAINAEEACIEPIKLQSLIVDNSTITRLQILRNPTPTLEILMVCDSNEEQLIFTGYENWMRKIRSLSLRNCRNLKSLPRYFHHLKRLKDLSILNCPNIRPLRSNQLKIPPSLINLNIPNCHEELSRMLTGCVNVQVQLRRSSFRKI